MLLNFHWLCIQETTNTFAHRGSKSSCETVLQNQHHGDPGHSIRVVGSESGLEPLHQGSSDRFHLARDAGRRPLAERIFALPGQGVWFGFWSTGFVGLLSYRPQLLMIQHLPNYPSRYPKYHLVNLVEAIRPFMEVRWGVLDVAGLLLKSRWL